MDIGQEIRKKREERKLTQTEIAEKIGIDTSSFARIEKKGNKLSVEQLEKIAGALGVSILELITGEPQKVQNDERVKELELRADYWYEMAETRNELLRMTEKYLHGYNDWALSELKVLVYDWLESNEGKHGIDENTKDLPITELQPTILRALYRDCINNYAIIDYAIAESLLGKKGEVFRVYHLEVHKEAIEAFRETKRRMQERMIERMIENSTKPKE
jgi:transcriptional regulator with XRE-family HTH domain